MVVTATGKVGIGTSDPKTDLEVAGTITAREIRTRSGDRFMQWVTVGNPNNSKDAKDQPYGDVSYVFQIGKYEVTNDQYAQFLNAVAKTDPFGLYHEEMAKSVCGGIARSGEKGSYSYLVKKAMGNKPVVYVSWYDAARFCNWMHNGMPSGDQNQQTTEDGAYAMNGAPNGQVSARKEDVARVFLPNENEWYKAAFYDPNKDGNHGGGYWPYPTQSSSQPAKATVDEIGNITNRTMNVANYDTRSVNPRGVTTVGSGGPGSESAYGAADMAGNVREWTETRSLMEMVVRGGSFAENAGRMSLTRWPVGPAARADYQGFRVARSGDEAASQQAIQRTAAPGEDALVVTASGKVGIRTSDPKTELDVAGTITAREIRTVGLFMQWVTVGNPNNLKDLPRDQPYGDVSYVFQIGKYEVTNDQYAQFLNAVAKTDPFGLYHEEMAKSVCGGIARSGEKGSYSYLVKKAMGNKPVIYVSWYNAARFCNWMHNGMPSGDQNQQTTEDGAYAMNGAPKGQVSPRKKDVARVFLPNRNEWYKAAYYDPNKYANNVGGYWTYPTQSNSQPVQATVDEIGNIANRTMNVANYDTRSVNPRGVTTVGSGGPGGESAYGAADMAGNVAEWTETQSAIGMFVWGVSFAAHGGRTWPNMGWPIVSDDARDYTGFRVAGSFSGAASQQAPQRTAAPGEDALVVAATGKVGIATSDPKTDLDVAGTITAREIRTWSGDRFMQWVTVGNPNNSKDAKDQPYGDVSYVFQIGKYEVTNDQYAQFLNAVAKTDPFGLYHEEMAKSVCGGIARSGEKGSYSYLVKKAMGNKPVVYVSWYNAARFCNWMHNGMPSGDQNQQTTEDGAYAMNGAPNGQVSARKEDVARVFLPNENEWYKAAFYDPNKDGNHVGGYWPYPTQSSSQPAKATVDEIGNISNRTMNVANYDTRSVNPRGVTTVGSGGPGSESAYGAADMAGNVREWTETRSLMEMVVRGGSFGENAGRMSLTRWPVGPGARTDYQGFRVARSVGP